jgi:hypothetical protein
MPLPGESAEHSLRVGEVFGLAEFYLIEADHRIAADNDASGMTGRDRVRFAGGEVEDFPLDPPPFRDDFGKIRLDGFKRDSQQCEDFAAPWGRRGKN